MYLKQDYDAERKRYEGNGIKKEKVVSRQPIFINLKSNTMKNTLQMYDIFESCTKDSAKKSYLKTLFNNRTSIFSKFLSIRIIFPYNPLPIEKYNVNESLS